ncbi:MAG: hypothetical protein Q9195_005891 [Heterodermia aff. obscurata]
MLIKVFALSLLGLQVAAVPHKAPLNKTILPREDLETPDLINPDLLDDQYCFDKFHGHESREESVLWASNKLCTEEVIDHQGEAMPARLLEGYYEDRGDLYLEEQMPCRHLNAYQRFEKLTPIFPTAQGGTVVAAWAGFGHTGFLASKGTQE